MRKLLLLFILLIFVSMIYFSVFYFLDRGFRITTKEEETHEYEFLTIEMFGAIGGDEVDDSKAFGEAIEASLKENLPLKILRNTHYVIGSPITIKSGTILEIGDSTSFHINGDFDSFILESDTVLSGGVFIVNSEDFQSSVFIINNANDSILSNVNIINTDNRGNAITILEDSGNNSYNKLKIYGFQNGIELIGTTVRKNYFENIVIDNTERALSINKSDENSFLNFQIYLTQHSKEAIIVTGSHNTFRGLVHQWEIFNNKEAYINDTGNFNEYLTNIKNTAP